MRLGAGQIRGIVGAVHIAFVIIGRERQRLVREKIRHVLAKRKLRLTRR